MSNTVTHNKKPRVGFVSSRWAFFPDDKTFLFNGYDGSLIAELLKTYPDMGIAIYEDKDKKVQHIMEFKPNKLYKLEGPLSFAAGLRNTFKIRKQLQKMQEEHDILIVQLSFVSFFALLTLRKPVVYQLCTNVLVAAENPVKYIGAKKMVSVAFANVIDWVHRRLFARPNVRVIANGGELVEVYKEYNPIQVISSCIHEYQLISPEEIQLKANPFSILFVGRPSLEKGIDLLMQSFADLKAMGKDVRLSFAGVTKDLFFEMNPEYKGIVQKYEADIAFLGTVPFGEKLFNLYKNSHALVLASRVEGTPRVLVEARAFGCPVVATRVGGTPQSVTDGSDGLLFDPENHQQLTAALVKLIDSPELRLQMAKNGLETVRTKQTLEIFAKPFVDCVEELAKNIKN
ncbi:Glycosyltransferase involved in cell wall bisynthesis [Flexibacter flexilis DSM 6793]|uniref:Glycosyltransferase involved in cell wall bisynthesis n=1 Tax=Flexibacter flexilis DSM 6793 TaxID=927664 RepID=A0A1I1FNU6_9BACT|nr:glycosyltransferase family 4 protein [Flexibacter flexilis]SFB99318.1 Glycosyltransferase involved in cell wall bisynthesis [Flexibacter flexilis DSM 6793]